MKRKKNEKNYKNHSLISSIMLRPSKLRQKKWFSYLKKNVWTENLTF